ncbi:hypothetical protein BJV78DRAFT_1157110 [Lactifluus subvellereus]|nr:hypothetical protein BJV78DRAFT_1157110 [Lactifluus subvellereus]
MLGHTPSVIDFYEGCGSLTTLTTSLTVTRCTNTLSTAESYASASHVESQQFAVGSVNPTGNAIVKTNSTINVPFTHKRHTVHMCRLRTCYVRSGFVSIGFPVCAEASFALPALRMTRFMIWSQAPTWPTDGEIDTFEGANIVSTLSRRYTEPGCSIINAVRPAPS